MRSIILPIVFMAATAFGGFEHVPSPYAITSLDRRYVFTMTPGPKGKESREGFGVCYEVTKEGKLEEQWRTKEWYAWNLVLSDDGQTLARIGNCGLVGGDVAENERDLAVALYKRGKLLARYSVGNLVKDESKLVYSEGGLQWMVEDEFLFPSFSAGGKSFQIKTVDGIHYLFDCETGEILNEPE